MTRADRPLSPHLQIYRWYLSMALSITHRITGVGLVLGLVLLTWWLTALARGPEAFGTVRAVMDNPLGWLVLFGLTFTLFFHLATGVRHLAWDLGYGFDKDVAYQTGLIAVGTAAALTVVTWLAILIAA